MSLKGNTKTMPLSELLRFLDSRQSTGILEFTRGNSWKRLYFEKGRIISSGSSEPTEYLGHFLISENKITEEQLTQALEVQKKTRVMLGKILVMIGAITEEDLLRLLELKCRESVFALFFWDDADFEFFDQQLPAVRLIPTSMEVEPLIREGLERREEWKTLKQTYASRDMIFARTDQYPDDSIMSNPVIRTIYNLLDGRRTIADLMIETHAGDYKVLHALDQLKKQKAIQVVSYGVDEPAARVELIAVDQVLQMGKNKLAYGKWEEAINLFNYVLQHHEMEQEAKELLARAESGLIHSIYEEVIHPDSVPQMAMSLEEIVKKNLSSEETFIVTRVNGRWDLKSILTITPLREVDALRLVRRLLERGIIRT